MNILLKPFILTIEFLKWWTGSQAASLFITSHYLLIAGSIFTIAVLSGSVYKELKKLDNPKYSSEGVVPIICVFGLVIALSWHIVVGILAIVPVISYIALLYFIVGRITRLMVTAPRRYSAYMATKKIIEQERIKQIETDANAVVEMIYNK